MSITVENQETMHSNTRSPPSLSTNIFPLGSQQPGRPLPISNMSLPTQQTKVASVFDTTSGLQASTCNPHANSTGVIPKHKTNHTFGAIR